MQLVESTQKMPTTYLNDSNRSNKQLVNIALHIYVIMALAKRRQQTFNMLLRNVLSQFFIAK